MSEEPAVTVPAWAGKGEANWHCWWVGCGQGLGKFLRVGGAGRAKNGLPPGAPGAKEDSMLPRGKIMYASSKAHRCHEWGADQGSGSSEEVEKDKKTQAGLSHAEGERKLGDWKGEVDSEPASSLVCWVRGACDPGWWVGMGSDDPET